MRRLHRIALSFAIAVSLSADLGAQEGDTRITDPALLTRLGLPPNAQNVFLAKGVAFDQKSSPTAPEEFGTTDDSFTTVPGNQHSSRTESTYGSFLGSGDIYLVSGDIFSDAQLQMPGGALLKVVAWWGHDVSPSSLEFFVLRICYSGPGAPTFTVLGSHESAGPGYFVANVVLAPAVTVDNAACLYIARTRFNAATSDLRLQRVLARWRRQVGPAPLTATFPNDVPVTHPFFRFIEALAAAGITGGCAPQSFCPSAAITRGEMAVFLSVALGLHWP